eukprot:TRINITY_DN12428_c0_g1_i2.p1 TRINITY_DN12428_c0_g1~~TRINITY_DN12428_c0_g1_i2.p1  ORF type:complete len:921 (-),score=210.57 TRINITY_DN12428_c0_g1_i2:310-3072(-)
MAWCCFSLLSRRGFALVLLATFAVDLAVCLAVFLIARADAVERHEGDSYASGATDSLICCVMRIVLFPLTALLALKVYNRTAAASPLKRLQSAEEPSGETNGCSAASMAIPLNSMNGSIESANCSQLTPERSAFEMKKEHNLLMKKADRRRNLVMALLFSLSTAMSLWNGLKCVLFHYDPQIVAIQGALLCSVIFFINIEYFMIRDFLGKLTEEQGELIPHIHLHELFFETGLKCHGCDVCHERMKGPHYIAYRCRTCDFDLCPRCYKQKDKATARGYGARSVRRDGEQITTWTYFKRILALCLEFKNTTVLALVSLMVCQGLTIIAPKIQGSIFDSILASLKDPSGPGRQLFHWCMFKYLIINVLQGGFGGLKTLSQELVTRSLACAVRTKLFTSIVRMDIAFFDAMHTGQLTSRLTNDASQMVQPLNTLMNDLIANLMLLVGGMVMAFETSWKLSTLALTVVPPITYCYRLYAHWARKVNRSIYAAYGEANSCATEAISNIRTVRGFSTEQYEADRYDDSIMTALGHGKKNAYVSGSVNAFTTYMNLGTAVLILWYGGEIVCESQGELMTIGKLITFQLYWNMMNSAFIALGNVFNDLIRSSSAAERVFSLIDARPEVDPDAGYEVTREMIKGHLQFEGVEFRYRTRPDALVLKGVTLDMPQGTTTALVGKSGGGKSTAVHLLMRFYEPTGGKILLDGRDMREMSSKSVRRLCGFVAQDTQLFATSIEENLAYGLGRPHTHEEVVQACKRANAHEFIMETEEQYETRVGEKGVMLSGGQRQRLAIARCFLRQPRLLFLDEATSALDAENEGLVQQALDDLISTGECTVVLIAHRLSTVINSNQIAVMHKGNIVERGTHEELCATGGVYSQLVKRQMSRDASAASAQREAKVASKSVQGEIDALFEEMEQSGSLGNLDD